MGTSFSASEPAPAPAPGDPYADTDLFPKTEPYETQTMKVSEIHTISWKIYGNPNGKPALYCHGGPGAGTSPTQARYFDPKVYRIFLVDQRGSGDSTPFAEPEGNNTWELVKDFEKVRQFHKVNKWLVMGGSWGTTIALTYAIMHPNVVTEIILRGVFILRKKEVDWFYQGGGAEFIYPEEWDEYINFIPEAERGDVVAAYSRRLKGEMGPEVMQKAANIWSLWEGFTSKLVMPDREAVVADFNDYYNLAFARIENHYFINCGFFPRDGWILEKANMDKIRHIPMVIAQGRYDIVCPARSACDLKKMLPHAELTYTLAGHSGYETETIKVLVAATEKFKYK